MSNKFIPQTLKGFRDYLPEEQIARLEMIEKIRQTYESYGFSPIETPALEYAELLCSKFGPENEKLIYRFKDNGERDVALIYDHTVPLARLIAQYPSVKKPMKVYQIGPLWRAENTQAGRFRQFYQGDADIIGTDSLFADLEIITLAAQILENLKLDFCIKINNRQILIGFLKLLKIDESAALKIMRTIDKKDKINPEQLKKDLKSLGLSAGQIEATLEFMAQKINGSEDFEAVINKYAELKEPLRSLQKLWGYIVQSKVKNCQIDFSLARGLDYYTGTIFEASLKNSAKYGSLCGGGRYDNLVNQMVNKKVPAVGMAIGLDRLFTALTELKQIKSKKNPAQIMLAFFDESLLSDYQEILRKLREHGYNVLFYSEIKKLGDQLKYAAENEIEFALIYGSQEKEKNEIIAKNLRTKEQITISLNELIKYFKEQIKIN